VQYEDEEIMTFLLDPHRQTLIDLEYVVKDLKEAKHDVLIFLDANKEETHQFRAQTHDVKCVTKNGLHVDGSMAGSLHAFMHNCGLPNVLKDLNEGTPPNTHNHGTQQIDFALATDHLSKEYIEQAGF
jgi:urease alpha subunit